MQLGDAPLAGRPTDNLDFPQLTTVEGQIDVDCIIVGGDDDGPCFHYPGFLQDLYISRISLN